MFLFPIVRNTILICIRLISFSIFSRISAYLIRSIDICTGIRSYLSYNPRIHCVTMRVGCTRAVQYQSIALLCTSQCDPIKRLCLIRCIRNFGLTIGAVYPKAKTIVCSNICISFQYIAGVIYSANFAILTKAQQCICQGISGSLTRLCIIVNKIGVSKTTAIACKITMIV